MSILITIVSCAAIILLSKYLFSKWFNHLSIYFLSWSAMIILYEVKLIRYVDLSEKLFIVVSATSLFYLLGVLTYFVTKDRAIKNQYIPSGDNNSFKLFDDKGKSILILLVICSLVGILDGLYQWKLLIDKFGGLLQVLVQANDIREMRLRGEIKGMIPYLFVVSFVGIFFGAIFSAYKNRFTLIGFLPLLAVTFKEIANFSRAGILLGFFEYFIVFFLFRNFLRHRNLKSKMSRGNLIVVSGLIIFIFLFSLVFIKSFRSPVDQLKASSTSLNEYQSNLLISPTVYLYTSSHIGVLNRYLENESERTMWGENTFLPIYNFLAKFELIPKPKFFQKGYFLPQWTNTGTYLREIHADFGYLGMFIIPYLLGLFTTIYWFKWIETGKLTSLIILTYLFLIVSFSFFVMITRLASWFLSFMLLLIIAPFIQNSIYFLRNIPSKNE